jgi:serine phosphatase RsbU (regulator of sigma subunit)
VRPLQLPVNLPLGLFADTGYVSTNVVLERGDRLVLVTDGMLERGAATLDLAAEIRRTRALHPRETTRRLTDKILETCGPTLADDATLLVLDWEGGHGRDAPPSPAPAPPAQAPQAPRPSG